MVEFVDVGLVAHRAFVVLSLANSLLLCSSQPDPLSSQQTLEDFQRQVWQAFALPLQQAGNLLVRHAAGRTIDISV